MTQWTRQFVVWCLIVGSYDLAQAEPVTQEVLACGEDDLRLRCDVNQVVAAEIYTVKGTCVTSGSNECACANASHGCLKVPIMSVSHINMCRWKKTTCTVKPMQPYQPCIVAKQFHCVARTDITDICARTAELTNKYGYITTPGYPSSFGPGLNCPVTIRIPSGKSAYVRVISSHMTARCESGNDRDYLTISADDGDVITFCGEVSYNVNKSWTISGSQVTLTFVSRDMDKSYQGFALYYELIEGVRTPVPTTSPSTTPAPYHVIVNNISASSFVRQSPLMYILVLLVMRYS